MCVCAQCGVCVWCGGCVCSVCGAGMVCVHGVCVWCGCVCSVCGAGMVWCVHGVCAWCGGCVCSVCGAGMVWCVHAVCAWYGWCGVCAVCAPAKTHVWKGSHHRAGRVGLCNGIRMEGRKEGSSFSLYTFQCTSNFYYRFLYRCSDLSHISLFMLDL